MLGITFSTARNSSKTCSCGNNMLHSVYNPEEEAERFVQALHCDFTPSFVIITEPGLSYCEPFLRERFPQAKLYAIRYDSSFSFCDKLWDKILSIEEISLPLSEILFNQLGEEDIFSTFFCAWAPSSRAFPLLDSCVWKEIKKAILKSRDVLGTRSYFSQRWISNVFSFCLNVSKTAVLPCSGSFPVVVAASGTSLAGSLPFLKKYRKSYYLIAVSSSLSVLLHNDIAPDICMSTDGGYYAEKHLIPLEEGIYPVPLALSPESACSKKIFEKYTIIPLSYGDGVETPLLNCCGIQSMHAERNGTVSGTAADFALGITSGQVFLCGLDLSSGPGYQHTQPNRLEIINSASDMRIKPKETRTAVSRFSSQSLSIYGDWFKTLPQVKSERLFRLSDNFIFNNNLGAVHDVNFSFFSAALYQVQVPGFINTPLPLRSERLATEKLFLNNTKTSDAWLHQIFPAEYLSRGRMAGRTGFSERDDILREKNDKLTAHLERMLI
jgi:hypothetical protein